MSDGSERTLLVRNLDTGEVLDIAGIDSAYDGLARAAQEPPKDLKFDQFVRAMRAPLFDLRVAECYREHAGAVRCLRASPDGRYVASGDEYGRIVLWECSAGGLRALRRYDAHAGDVTCLAFAGDGLLLSSSLDRMVKLWLPAQDSELAAFQHDDSVTAVAFHPRDPSTFVACSFTNAAYVWDIKHSELRQTLSFASTPTAVAFSPDGRIAVIGCMNGMCFTYSCPGFEYVTQFAAGPRSKKQTPNKKITSIEFVDASNALVATNDSRVRLFSMENFQLVRKFIGHVSERSLHTLSCTSDGKLMMIPSEKNSSVFMWPIDHEKYFKPGILSYTFCRERSKTCQGFSINKRRAVTSAVFLAESTIRNPRILFADADGTIYNVTYK